MKWAEENGPNIGIGSVVLLQEVKTPPLKWKMGKVMDVKTGNNYIIRSAVLKTENGGFCRAVR